MHSLMIVEALSCLMHYVHKKRRYTTEIPVEEALLLASLSYKWIHKLAERRGAHGTAIAQRYELESSENETVLVAALCASCVSLMKCSLSRAEIEVVIGR
eukprot:scaffold18034_cov93-Skeletonema_dohrnii-CCMP3373.AAC.1